MKKSTDNSMFTFSPDKQQLIVKLRGLLMSSSIQISEIVKYGRLTYIVDDIPVAFICAKRDTNYVEVGFFKAVYLSDPKKLFKGNAKEIKRIQIKSIEEIPVLQIKKWVKEATSLNY